MKIKSIAILFWLFFSGTTEVENLSGIDRLESEVVQTDELIQPMYLTFSDGLLLLTDAGVMPAIHVMNAEEKGSLEYIEGIGKEGQGPGEYTHPQDVIFSNGSEFTFYVYDARNRTIVPYDESFSAVKDQIITIRSDGLPTQLFESGDEFLFSGIVIEGHLELINKSGETVKKVGEVDELESWFTERNLARAWRMFGAQGPEGEKWVLFAMHANMGIVIDREGNELSRFEGSEDQTPSFDMEQAEWGNTAVPTTETINAYVDVSADENHIYALYSGDSYNLSQEEDGSSYGAEIHKFDWNLDLKQTYELDHRAFSIESDNRGGVYTVQHFPKVAVRYSKIPE